MKFKRYLLNSLIIIVSIFLVYKVASFIHLKREEKASNEIYNDLGEEVFLVKPSTKTSEEKNVEESSEVEEESSELSVDFEKLYEMNEDISFWMTSESGYINYPIVRGKDNNEYLRKAFTGEPNILGTIFLDYRNEVDDAVLLIYGHMMDTDSIFGSLKNFKKEDYEDTFNFYTPEEEFVTQPVLASIISGETQWNPVDFEDFEKRKELFSFLKDKAVHDKNYDLKEEDELVLLVTCTYEAENVRLVVVTVKEGV